MTQRKLLRSSCMTRLLLSKTILPIVDIITIISIIIVTITIIILFIGLWFFSKSVLIGFKLLTNSCNKVRILQLYFLRSNSKTAKVEARQAGDVAPGYVNYWQNNSYLCHIWIHFYNIHYAVGMPRSLSPTSHGGERGEPPRPKYIFMISCWCIECCWCWYWLWWWSWWSWWWWWWRCWCWW